MHKIHSSIIGANNLPISIDCTAINDNKIKPLVIFCHGFKGFKDWGAWDLVANKFAQNDFIFLKFNFSHNGTSLSVKDDFVNLEAFSENNYSKELDDLQTVLDWVNSNAFPLKEQHNKNIFLVGHSRGGGAVLVKQAEEKSITKTCTWASIDTYDRFGTKAQIDKWKEAGEHLFINGRTGQKMPISYQFYSDYLQNIDRLDIKKAVQNNSKPLLIIHGTNDPAVNIESAQNLYSWSENSELLEIEDANHVFGSRHPFLEDDLPSQLATVVNSTMKFFKK
jgi:pimeloyl-ACP methyl ester carboxylesterase